MIKLARKIFQRTPQFDPISYFIHNSRILIHNAKSIHSPNPRIRNIMIEPTNDCNLKCYMCHAKSANREKGFMTMETYKRILDEGLREKVKNVVLHTVGESLLHPNIVDMIKLAKSKGFITRLSSNGTLLNPNLSKSLVESGLDQFRFSLEGAKKETYENIRIGGDFNTLLANMKALKEIRDKHGRKPNITISSIIMKQTEPELDDFYKKFLPLVDFIEFRYLVNQAGQVDSVFRSFSSEDMSTYAGRCPCKLLWSTVVILWNGDVSCCCVDFDGRLVVGNILDKPLHEIWNSDKYKKFRRLHKTSRQHEMEMCGDCTSTQRSNREYALHKLNRRLKRLYGGVKV